jgi:hypothetical protein
VLQHRRELLADGQPIKLGGRAFDIRTGESGSICRFFRNIPCAPAPRDKLRD